MKKIIIYSFISILLSSCNNEEKIHLNLDKLSDLDEMIQNEIKANNIPGAVVLVGNEKETAYLNCECSEIPTRNFEIYDPFKPLDTGLKKNECYLSEPKETDNAVKFRCADLQRKYEVEIKKGRHTNISDYFGGRMYRKCNENYDRNKPNPSSSWAPYKIFNIGNSDPQPLMEYIKSLENCLNKKALINFLPMQPGDVKSTYANTELLEEWIGFRPKTSIDYGIKQFVKWYKNFYKIQD